MDFIPHKSHKVPTDLSHFWVVTVLSNSPRYKRRYELYERFADMVESAGVKLVTVELQLGVRPFMITSPDNPRHLQLRTIDEIWHKENLLNLAIAHAARLDPLMTKVAWIDADLMPMNPPRVWFEQTCEALEHYRVVQMFSELQDVDYDGRPLGSANPSYMQSYMTHDFTGPVPNQHCRENQKYCKKHHPWHAYHFKKESGDFHSGSRAWFGAPGGAFGAELSAISQVGLPERCIVGSGDWHFCSAVTESLSKFDVEMINNKYTSYLLDFQEKAKRWIKRDVGVVKGGLIHHSHGPKRLRNYMGRKEILTLNDYAPWEDVKPDHCGVLQLETWTERQIRLRDLIRNYFRERNDDLPEYKA